MGQDRLNFCRASPTHPQAIYGGDCPMDAQFSQLLRELDAARERMLLARRDGEATPDIMALRALVRCLAGCRKLPPTRRMLTQPRLLILSVERMTCGESWCYR